MLRVGNVDRRVAVGKGDRHHHVMADVHRDGAAVIVSPGQRQHPFDAGTGGQPGYPEETAGVRVQHRRSVVERAHLERSMLRHAVGIRWYGERLEESQVREAPHLDHVRRRFVVHRGAGRHDPVRTRQHRQPIVANVRAGKRRIARPPGAQKRAAGIEIGEPTRRSRDRRIAELYRCDDIAVRQPDERMQPATMRHHRQSPREARRQRSVEIDQEGLVAGVVIGNQRPSRRQDILGVMRHPVRRIHRECRHDSAIAAAGRIGVEDHHQVRAGGAVATHAGPDVEVSGGDRRRSMAGSGARDKQKPGQ
ncbi:MAG TPA: hypothetical protein VGL65_08625 [Gemmatimonadales bacterium]